MYDYDMERYDRPKLHTSPERWQATKARGFAYYAAFGSNLHLGQMKLRCPDAEPLTKFVLSGWRLVFRGVADLVRDPDASVPVGVFKITPKCELALDRYEGYPHLYTKAQAKLRFANGATDTVMFYVMTSRNYLSSPGETYLRTIQQGYDDFGMGELAHRRLLAAAREAQAHEEAHLRHRDDLRRTERGGYVAVPRKPVVYEPWENDREREKSFPRYDEREWAKFVKHFGIDPDLLDTDDTTLADIVDTFRSYE